MISLLTATLLATKLALYAYALPLNPRTVSLCATALNIPHFAMQVTSLNQAAVDEAHQHDNTATRAFTAIQMKVCMLLGG
jgi:disulfide bond formation protein DsbB